MIPESSVGAKMRILRLLTFLRLYYLPNKFWIRMDIFLIHEENMIMPLTIFTMKTSNFVNHYRLALTVPVLIMPSKEIDTLNNNFELAHFYL